MELRRNFFALESQRQNLRAVRLEPPQPGLVHTKLGLEPHEVCEHKNISVHLKPAYFSWAGCSAS